ncbi:MAG: hypothetical protein P4M11_11280 [Candidatus Pacebacteria bacterium]|nr:hypothetical protein [Candidatus Paceibacterota bacterium]
MQSQLETLLMTLMDRNERVHYVQGLNDVAAVLLVVLGPDLALALPALESVCRFYLKYL